VLFVLQIQTEITDASGFALGRFTRLSSLDLSRSCITDQTIRSIAGLVHVSVLNIQYTAISDWVFELLAPLLSLTSLNIAGCASITDAGIQSFVQHCPRMLQRLTWFSLGSSSITGISLQVIMRPTRLEEQHLFWY
jgi:hypothetical protein